MRLLHVLQIWKRSYLDERIMQVFQFGTKQVYQRPKAEPDEWFLCSLKLGR